MKFTKSHTVYLADSIQVPSNDYKWRTLNRNGAFVEVDAASRLQWIMNSTQKGPSVGQHEEAQELTAQELPQSKRQKRALRKALRGHGLRVFVEEEDMVLHSLVHRKTII